MVDKQSSHNLACGHVEEIRYFMPKWAWPPSEHRRLVGVSETTKMYNVVFGSTSKVNCYLEIKIHKKIRLTPLFSVV